MVEYARDACSRSPTRSSTTLPLESQLEFQAAVRVLAESRKAAPERRRKRTCKLKADAPAGNGLRRLACVGSGLRPRLEGLGGRTEERAAAYGCSLPGSTRGCFLGRCTDRSLMAVLAASRSKAYSSCRATGARHLSDHRTHQRSLARLVRRCFARGRRLRDSRGRVSAARFLQYAAGPQHQD